MDDKMHGPDALRPPLRLQEAGLGRRRLLLAFLASAFACAPAQREPTPVPPTLVIVVRHAEKALLPANDPPLSDAGVARAKALAAALEGADVQAVISTPLVRTMETARPIAELHGLAIDTIRQGASVTDHAAAVSKAVRRHAGKTVLVVGHSDTVAPIIAALGGPKIADLCSTQYSDLFILVLDGSGTRFARGTYGAPSPGPATSCLNKAF